MNRRESVSTLLTLGALPFVCLAQQAGRSYRIGLILSQSEPYAVAFVDRLRELGFVEGRNLVIDFRWHEGHRERLPELAVELARLNCDVLVAPGSEANLLAIKQASRDTPIVVWAADYDPVATGHIASFARPGGRITGVSLLQSELPAKRVELLKQMLPTAKRFAVLADSATAGQLAVSQAAAKQLGMELQVLEFKTQPYDYEGAFAEAVRAKVQALISLASANFVPARRRITDLALKHRLPSMFAHSQWAEFGGLLSYGPNFSQSFRRVAEQVGLILNGRKPADMPLEQPTTLELVINMQTAKAIGLTIPPVMLLRADRVIE
jgi:putative tryptophan/tyrosine transport system substrate-binding protein